MAQRVQILQASAAVQAHRDSWVNRGDARPAFADPVAPGQRSVWDFPRPPIMAPLTAQVIVQAGDQVLARSTRAVEVRETSSAPTLYLPAEDVQQQWLQQSESQSHCEWKGVAEELQAAPSAPATFPRGVALGWRYLAVYPEFEVLYGWYAFYPQRLDCFVDGEQARPQPGGYYGGWVLSDLAGPIKGGPESAGW